uniref:DNA excision repair protein ERCC-6 n=1 Tax=Mesocestoides corti TaxID=53468 RepID=A0A5K3FDE2_MESCO
MKVDRSRIKVSDYSEVSAISQVDAAYEEADLDAGVCAQVEEALRKRCPAQEKLLRNLQNIREDIKFTKDMIKQLEVALDGMLCSNEGADRVAERKIRSLENEIETKMKLLDTLQKREAAYQDMLDNKAEPDRFDVVTPSALNESSQSGIPTRPQRPASKPSVSVVKNTNRQVADTDDADLKTFERRVLWEKLYGYQREGVSWLWGLHQQGVGGILGDEMGLGKTIQVIAFLAALRHSKLETTGGSFDVAVSQMKQSSSSETLNKTHGLGPVLIVCPGTVLKQWLAEFREWIPTARVVIVHSSGSGYHNISHLVSSLFVTSGVALTTYGTLTQHKDLLLPLPWHYLILDEGHKIKNPEADITVTVKRVETAYRCACTLKNLLSPYLLRRMKSEVHLELPKKSEQVLFCHLTNYQRSLYEEYLNSKACQDILQGKGLVFKGLILLKKLCNHPDLVTGGPRRFGMRFGEDQDDLLTGDFRASEEQEDWQKFGCSRRSGKLLVTLDLLSLWREQNHKVLLFSQSRKMLTLLEKHLQRRGYSYLRMDGTTAMGQRQRLVEEFNSSSCDRCFVFLLTTRVGGLGVNLTGANRVLIYDPDWNPSTDAQARERAWRIGQLREVVVYRLLASGTIEEKIYQRQIFKQFLTNRVLKNPGQQRFFKINDLQELFSIADAKPSEANGGQRPESASFFKCVGIPKHAIAQPLNLSGNRFDRLLEDKQLKADEASSSESENASSQEGASVVQRREEETQEEREARLRAQARLLSRKLVEKYGRKRKRGTRVDGHRIRGVEKLSRLDEGAGSDIQGTSEAPRTDIDPFVASVLCGSGGDNTVETNSDRRLQELKAKLQRVDEDMREEAERVAKAALEAIRGKKKTHSSRHQRPSRRNRIGAQSAASRRLRNLTTVNHDRLMNEFLMPVKAVDPSLVKLQAARLASSVVAWLHAEALKICRPTAAVDVPLPSPLRTTFGLAKNPFLWSPQEIKSPLYLSYMALDGVRSPQSDDWSKNFLYTGHNRLSSRLLLQVIRTRRDRSMTFLGISAPSLLEGGSAESVSKERELRKVALDLLRLFSERRPTPSTSTSEAVVLVTNTDEIAARFEDLLSTNDSSSGLNARHFRALLRALAVAPAKGERGERGTTWTLKPRFVMIARRFALAPTRFAP